MKENLPFHKAFPNKDDFVFKWTQTRNHWLKMKEKLPFYKAFPNKDDSVSEYTQAQNH